MNILTVPEISQIETGALQHNNDCGAAAGLMEARAYNLALDLDVDQFYDRIWPAGDVGLSAGGIQILLATLGLKNDWKVAQVLHDVYDCMIASKPVITLIHYAPIVQAGFSQRKDFLGAHFVVVVGVDNKSVAINDPYRDDNQPGIEVPHEVFLSAWYTAHLDGNLDGAMLIPQLPIQDLSFPIPAPTGTRYALLVNGLNIRTGPAQSYPLQVSPSVVWRSVQPVVTILKTVGKYGQLAAGGWVAMEFLKPLA
jgi:hypothetical protein